VQDLVLELVQVQVLEQVQALGQVLA